MRELKFRAWDTEAKCYVELNNLRGERSIYFSPYDLRAIHPEVRDRVVLEQYTGLKDKNGKEIYEGDIVKFENRNYKVVFDDYGQFCLENRSYHWLENGYSFNSVSIWNKNEILVEVIGNIHENPELIGENQQ